MTGLVKYYRPELSDQNTIWSNIMLVTNKYVLFWDDFDIYSNFYPSEFDMEGHHFYWSEQAFMWQKAIAFGDSEIAEKILTMKPDINTALECKNLGRKVSGFDSLRWDEISFAAMKKALHEKFTQDSFLHDQLIETGNLILVEASPYDKIWGIGLSENDPDAQDETKWKGSNLLGKVLMEVREELMPSG